MWILEYRLNGRPTIMFGLWLIAAMCCSLKGFALTILLIVTTYEYVYRTVCLAIICQLLELISNNHRQQIREKHNVIEFWLKNFFTFHCMCLYGSLSKRTHVWQKKIQFQHFSCAIFIGISLFETMPVFDIQ